MPRPRILAVVQAGGAGSRMDVLTRERAKPALPFAGVYQLVDLPLSNLAHSGVDDVWLSVQFQGSTLEEQVANGRPWNLDRTRGGLRLLMPQQGAGSLDEDGFATGNADELYRIRDRIAAHDPEVVLVMSADHVYRLDYGDVVRTHRERGAECTVVTTEVPLAEAGAHAEVQAGDDGVVTAVRHKPDDPATGVVAAEVVAYHPGALVEVLEELHRELGGDAAEGDSGLGDFSEHLLPRFAERGRAVVHPLEGYWRDLGQPSQYVQAHLDVVAGDLGVLDDPDWPVLTQQPQRRPARVRPGAELLDALVSPGGEVAGRVERSVLGPGVVVAAGAEVVESVLLADVVVEPGARVSRAVVDRGCVVGAGAVVGEPTDEDPTDEALVLVGRDSRVPAGAVVPPGSRLEPGTSGDAEGA